MPRRNVRRSQAVVPFGVGAIVDFEDEALLAAGLDAWPEERPGDLLYDERLAMRAGVRYFRQPPAYDFEHRDQLPYVRFPYWHFCPRCRALHHLRGNEPRRPACAVAGDSPALRIKGQPSKQSCAELPPKKRRTVLPLRFVVACKAGHIEDFPWAEWVHAEKGKQGIVRGEVGCAGAQLYFYPTRRGGLGGLLVHCGTCLKRRSMMGATGELRGFACSGARPWLGPRGGEQCAQADSPTVLQRGASNIYFPSVDSSVLIPPFSKAVRRIIENPRLWEHLTAQREQGRIPDAHIETAARAQGVSIDELRDAVHAKDSGEGVGSPEQTEAEFRFDEYRALLRKNASTADYLVTHPQDVGAYGKIVRDTLEAVVLVESLAETRALRGFARIEDSADRAEISLTPKNWAPAYRVHGEGLFLVFREDLLARWRDAALDALLARAASEPRITLPATPELVALHTLAHALIARLAFDSGYGASSIRERLYSCPAGTTTPMRGLLLYTAAGDAEGTLGGLVRLGRPGRLERLLDGALSSSVWCSSDPVCRESAGQGIGSLNLAACHACCLLPETSCETGNRLLDRLSLVGSGSAGGDPRRGLFCDFVR